VGLDGYNNGSGDGGKWQSLSSVFGESYQTLAALSSKPILITETGSSTVGGNRAKWLVDGLLDTVPQQLPRVRAVILFDQNTNRDWEITPGTPTASALRVVAQSANYSSLSPRRFVELRPLSTIAGRESLPSMGSESRPSHRPEVTNMQASGRTNSLVAEGGIPMKTEGTAVTLSDPWSLLQQFEFVTELIPWGGSVTAIWPSATSWPLFRFSAVRPAWEPLSVGRRARPNLGRGLGF
jgi:hypothetical protein